MRARRAGHLARSLGAVAVLALGLTACASQEPESEEAALFQYDQPNDPLEEVNRGIFQFNRAVDTVLLKPAAQGYDQIPEGFRNIIGNVLNHISLPVILVNDLAQGEWERAGDSATRLFVNTFTLGTGDLVPKRHPYHQEDFGQTMAVHGVDDGFYLVLPIFGPSSARDGVGIVADIFLTPWTYVDGTTTFSLTTLGVDGVRQRHAALGKLEELERDSVDFYARMRSLYYQRRQMKIDNTLDAGPDIATTEETIVSTR
ncbi:phospholipid-binding lipoprotein MlaA [Limimonas halophila]|uniref:Phospholipid-binding lipoprotein MlaA n=1 Tax=Limimonas halophila TaxID=1082479 RepID=A0A1G7LM82_9PROT|nr:VacJ family lipoprotein [Limimonas halophila]SDF50496.1 phospholipid-binding lipoprotein MlaA [Limimonas halophila]